jgi:hypothetical protein
MVDGRGKSDSRQGEEECGEARESAETSKRSIRKHFGLTSRKKGGGVPFPPENTASFSFGRNDEQMEPELKDCGPNARLRAGLLELYQAHAGTLREGKSEKFLYCKSHEWNRELATGLSRG